jgi:hypothetical protein
MTERPGEFGISNIGIMKHYKWHRYPNAIRKPEIKAQFISHNVMAYACMCGRVDCCKIYCSQLDFSLESKPTFLSNKYAQGFLWEQICPVIAGMIPRLQEKIRFTIF